jgi:hypothetical protein
MREGGERVWTKKNNSKKIMIKTMEKSARKIVSAKTIPPVNS